jgi:hypothetical protein
MRPPSVDLAHLFGLLVVVVIPVFFLNLNFQCSLLLITEPVVVCLFAKVRLWFLNCCHGNND